MKTPYLLITLLLAATLFADDGKTPVTSEAPVPLAANSHESFKAQVLKVYTARDGDAEFRAYVVMWRNQEVVVSDDLVSTDYQVGDTVAVSVMKQDYPNGKKRPGLLAFIILPKKIADQLK